MVEKTVNTEELAQVARSDTPLGFRIFYVLVHNKPMPRHAEAWVEQINRALSVLIEAFRGSTKTTVVNTYLAYRIGLEPHKANLLIQVGDQIAQDNAALIADIIENNSGFKLCFPNVIPDKERGWGAMGYEVKRTDIEYADWRRMNSDRKDPTLIGLGYTSGAIIGKHPDGVLVMDDVDNEENTSSPRERARTDKILTGTIFETIVPGKTKTVVIGTPWTMNDTISYIKATGLFDCTRTPVYAAPGVPTWPDKFPEEEIERHRKLAGAVEFARMFLLDLEAARGIHLKHEWLHYYPADKIDPSWPIVMGVDYASTIDKLRDSKRDYFALSVCRILPGGGAVLVDGFRGHLSQGEAETKVQAIAAAYPTLYLIGVEAIGKGEEFYSLLLRNTKLPILACHTGRKSKGERFEKQMAPLFEYNRAWISDAANEFIKHFISEWTLWPLGEHDDTLDAVYYALAVSQDSLAPPRKRSTLPQPWYEERTHSNPYAALGRK